MRTTMTAVTALLALALTGCSSDAERVDENSTITLGLHGLQLVVPADYRQADEALVRKRIEEDLARFDTVPDKPTKPTQGGKATAASATAGAAAPEQSLLDAYEAYLIDPTTATQDDPTSVSVTTVPTPLTTGTASTTSTALALVPKIGSVTVFDQPTKAGAIVRSSYQITTGKAKDGDDVEVSYQVIQLGLDDTSSLQVTVTSMDEDVARDLADTVVASLAPIS